MPLYRLTKDQGPLQVPTVGGILGDARRDPGSARLSQWQRRC